MTRKNKSHISRTPEVTSKIMSSIRSTGSKAEIQLGKAMWKAGLRYRKQYRKLKGKPDYVFVSARVAVFCDGDFWHGKDFDERLAKNRFKNNKEYWVKKITRNMERDKEVNESLTAEGWKVLRFWETEILESPDRCAGIAYKVVKHC